jgi:hypothetical protein
MYAHPYIAQQLIEQRVAEGQARAERAAQARAAREAARARRKQAKAAPQEIPMPRIPDYVDELLHELEDRAQSR